MILDRICPICEGAGDSPHCPCEGHGLLGADEDETWAAVGIALAVVPRPPEKLARPCSDCAFRAASPERDNLMVWFSILDTVRENKPFHCHVGMHETADGRYVPREMTKAGEPVGHPVCAGWQAARRRLEARLVPKAFP